MQALSASDCTQLVWFKPFETEEEAEAECARISRWPLAWQMRLIESENARFEDLWATLSTQPTIKVSPDFNASLSGAETSYPVIRIAHAQTTPERDDKTLAPILIRHHAS